MACHHQNNNMKSSTEPQYLGSLSLERQPHLLQEDGDDSLLVRFELVVAEDGGFHLLRLEACLTSVG